MEKYLKFEKMKNLTQDQWKEEINASKNAVIMDVRTPAEWSEGIIEEAEMLDFLDHENFKKEIQQLDKDKSYYLYCRSGARSGQACQMMSQLGLQANNLIGGIMEWKGEVKIPS